MEMAMHTKAKTNTNTRTKTATNASASTSTRATTKAKATVRTATGNGYSYTQNISTVKKFIYYKECSISRLAQIPNNKTKIKISQYKRKRNHLKFLTNLYIKLISYISHIIKIIFKIFKTKLKTYYNYKNCILNLQQLNKQNRQEKTQHYKMFSYKWKIFIDFLIKFYHCKEKNLINFIKLKIRQFVGICLKRLISLKKLQQIPENHKKILESLNTKEITTKIYHYELLIEELKQLYDQKFQLNKQNVMKQQSGKFNKSLKALLSWQEKLFQFLYYKINYKDIEGVNLKTVQSSRQYFKYQKHLCYKNKTQLKNQQIGVKSSRIRTSADANKTEQDMVNENESPNNTEFTRQEILSYSNKKYKHHYTIKYCDKIFKIFTCFTHASLEQKLHWLFYKHSYNNKRQVQIYLKPQYKNILGNCEEKCSISLLKFLILNTNTWQKCGQLQGIQHESRFNVKPKSPHKKLTLHREVEMLTISPNSSQTYKQLKCHKQNVEYNQLNRTNEVPEFSMSSLLKHSGIKVCEVSLRPELIFHFVNETFIQKQYLKNRLAFKHDINTTNWSKLLIHKPAKNICGPQSLLQTSNFFIKNTATKFLVTSKAHNFSKTLTNSYVNKFKDYLKSCFKNGLQKQTSLGSLNGVEALILALKTNIARQFLFDDNDNSHQVESKQQKFLKKFQHILYAILLYYYYYCCCYWHIYGYPLVLVKIFKYFKDATVHMLTRQFKITTAKSSIATIYTNYGNFKAACDRKLNKPTRLADYKANQQNVLKTQTHTTAISSGAYTISLETVSSSFLKSPKNLILQEKPPQDPCMPNPCYQQYHLHQHHQHHHYQPNQQIQQKQQSQLQHQKQQPSQSQLQSQSQSQQYNFNSTVHLQLPTFLLFSRTLIILILLSSLWHTSEGFHGSGVKLSTNTVKTKYGLVRGIVVRSSPSLVEAYLGIPYASPPVGSLRFMPPITPSTWKNVRNADRFSPVCPQNVPIPPNGPEALLEVPRARLAQLRRLLPLLSNQSEDCLYLNIYVPFENRRHRRFTSNSGESSDTPKLPTILFIHGESYEWNSGNPYDGSELAAHGNVIVITINFRLGILGFLKTGGKESAQGNFGLMDLVAGLHWLKENLPAFGGDPQQITLLGHGTGAALANILVVSPVASDLIQHTVMVSGSALSPWAIQKNPLFVKRRVAEQTGCHGDMLYYDLAPCLRTKTVAELLAVKIDHPRFLVGFAPFIDGTVISAKTDAIGKLSLPLGSAIVSTSGIEYANFPKRNLIFCLTSVESHLDLNAQDLEFGFNETRRDRILRTYVRNNFHYHLNEIFAVLKNEYTDWDKAIRSPLSSRDATLQFLSDGHTASSLIKLGYMHSLRGGRGYFLHFKHRTVEEEYPQRTGSVRGEDVPFWLGLPISPLFPHNYTTQEKQISHLMLRYLANFAKTGNPNQSSFSSSLPSPSSLSDSLPLSSSSPSSASSQTADDSSEKTKRSSSNIVNATSSTSSGPIKSSNLIEDVATAAAREALNLAVLYNQRRTKRTYYKRHSRSNDDYSSSASSEVNYFLNTNNNNRLDSDELPFWDAYDVVNQLYMELGNKAEIQSHYRGHKLSMWLNLIPQLHRHANMNDQSMRHHQFQDDLNNLNIYEGIVRAQIQTKPDDDEETILLPKSRPTPLAPAQETNGTQKPQSATTECGVDGAMFVAEMTTLSPADNRSLVLDSHEKEMATASTGLIGNLEVLRRLSGKQFQSYTTALIATVAVGCFLLILNILIFAGIYHQREKRARDAKTKEELQDNDTSKNSSILKLNAMGSETGSLNGSGAGVSGKTTVVFGEYSCYDEKSLQTKDEKLIVELPPTQILDANWAGCSTSTLDLLKTKHHTPLDTTYTLSNVVPIRTEPQSEHLIAVNNLEMATYNPLPMTSSIIVDPSFGTTLTSGLLSKRGSVVGSSGQLNQYDFASVQSSDQMSFKDIENAVKASATINDDIMKDDDIPEPPPPPRSFQSMQQQHSATSAPATACGSGGGGILRQAGTTSTTQTGGGKKRVHIQEISV